ncbi:MAG: succinate--CoA ligase subunit beta, partial [Kamptonema sp. SIO4C4]|nr:succinate--CoA ligase subunit beta [Kamptonema sp. SIO4C4]
MDLLEYQAKELFREVGIPVLPSQPIADSREIKQLRVSYPIVLKSQVRSGGRAKAGGIRFAENTIDAIAAAQTILNLPISGEYPQLLLVEARYEVQREIFLAIVLDYQLNHPILLGSACGGIQVEDLLKNMHKVVIDEDFSPFYARRLAIQMGLQGDMIRTISDIVQKMFQQGRVRLLLDLVDDRRQRLGGEGVAAGEQLVHDHADGEDVRLAGHLVLADLLRGHVQRRAHVAVHLGVGAVGVGEQGDAEIADLHLV